MFEKYASETIKIKESDDHCEQYALYEHGEWESIDAGERNVLAWCAPNMIKYIAGPNHHENIVMMIDKSNTTKVCPVCGENED